MSRIDVTKDGVVNTITSSIEFARTVFPVADGYSHAEAASEEPVAAVLTLEESNSLEERRWRNLELKDSDWIIPVSDHPQHAAYITYRAALRAWPASSDFPDTRPELGS